MRKLLVIDDDPQVIGLHKMRLGDSYQIVDTMKPEDALGLALEHKPVAVLMDLMMPKFSGFELCQTLHSLSYTSLIPIFVITGESAAKYKEHCVSLGARAFFEKPVDYPELKRRLSEELTANRAERRAHVRVRMRLLLRLRGADAQGHRVDTPATTENVSAGGLLCDCAADLSEGTVLDVFLSGQQERLVGRARIVRVHGQGTVMRRFAMQFSETTSEWIMRS
jgi:response regulator RpfG family c-di-GMP phosphodiesterase